MFEIDRMLVIIRPTERFVEYLISQDIPISHEDAMQDATCILIPTFDDYEHAHEHLTQIYADIVANELEEWDIPQESLPIDSFDMFLQFFTLELHSMVLDSVSEDYLMPTFVSQTIQ